MGTITRSFANLITASGPSGLPAGLAANTPAFSATKNYCSRLIYFDYQFWRATKWAIDIFSYYRTENPKKCQ